MSTLDVDDLAAIGALIDTTAIAASVISGLTALAVTIASPVATDGSITIYAGDDYSQAEGRALEFTVTDATHLLGLDNVAAELRLKMGGVTWTGEATSTPIGYTVVFEPDAAATGALVSSSTYKLEATTAAGSNVTLQTGRMTIR
jgi:hypothetical protein